MKPLKHPFNNSDFLRNYIDLRDNPVGQNALIELPAIFSLFPDIAGSVVLDFGCGIGEICRYALKQGARSTIGIDLSHEMVELARQRTDDTRATYITSDILEFNFEGHLFDLIVSSLTLHYIERYDDLFGRVRNALRPGGLFLFSIEHPIYTAPRTGWKRADDGARDASTPLDYGAEGLRTVPWLGYEVLKYHRKLETYIASLLKWGFTLKAVLEPQPDAEQLKINPHLQYETLTPPFLVIAASA